MQQATISCVRLEDNKLKLRVGAREREALNWSIGGFRAHGLEGLDLRERFTGMMEPQGGPSCEFTGQVTRVDNDGSRAVRFVEVDLSTLLALQETSGAQAPFTGA